MVELIMFIVGFLLAFVLFKKSIKIEVHHKYENIATNFSNDTISADGIKMSEVMNKSNVDEDKAYDEMGSVIQEINKTVHDVFGGSDRR